MKKTISMHEERKNKHEDKEPIQQGAVPGYLLDRENTSRAKVLSNMTKQKRKEKAGKWNVPLPKVRPIAEDEMFRVIRSGKRKANQYKRMVTKATFVGDNFTRKPPKYERYIRPTGLRFKKSPCNASRTKEHILFRNIKCKKESTVSALYKFRCINKRNYN